MSRKPRNSKRSAVIEIISHSSEATQMLGCSLVESFPIPGVILLQGALGTGKTTLTRGIAQGLGLSDLSVVSSPSFSLVNIYHGRCCIYHVDLYRLSGSRDLYTTGIGDFLGVDGVTIIEWSDRLLFPVEAALSVKLFDLGGESRKLRIAFSKDYASSALKFTGCLGPCAAS